MAKRLIDTSFLQSATFLELDKDTRLFYITMICQADDLGFVDTISSIGALLELTEERTNEIIECLVAKGYVIEFVRKRDKIYVIKHWFIHNKYRKGLWTRFQKQSDMLTLDYGVYELQEKTLKESNINQNKVIQNKVNNNEECSQEEWENLIGELQGEENDR